MAKPTKKPMAKMTYATCTILASFTTVCPLCRTVVVPGELHECSRGESQ
jgi:hypothetical protein